MIALLIGLTVGYTYALVEYGEYRERQRQKARREAQDT